MPSPPMNPIFQPVQEPDIITSKKEMPASILPSLSSSKVGSQLQQISVERQFSPASKTAEDTTLDPSTIPNLLSLVLRPPSPPQPLVTQMTRATLYQVQQPSSHPQPLVTQITQATLYQVQQTLIQSFLMRWSCPCLDSHIAYPSIWVAPVPVISPLPLLDIPVIPTPDLVNRLVHRKNKCHKQANRPRTCPNSVVEWIPTPCPW